MRKIPFYSNTPDNTHCFQASLKMILKYYWPNEEYGWEELDRITAKKESLWTWPMAGLIWLKEKGLEVIDIEPFDYNKFIELGGQYLIDEYGEEVGNAQIRNSDIGQEIKIAKKFIETIEIKRSIPEQADIKRFLEKDYIVAANVNADAMDEKIGYSGHFVVIFGFDEKNFILHDPGLPATENRKVPFEIFEKAWAYPNEKAKNIMAFKL